MQHVPVLDDLAGGIETEDVNPCPVVIARPMLEAVKDDEFVLGDHVPELDPLAGVLARHPLEIFDERVLAVADPGVVLRVRRADVAGDRLFGLALVEHEVVESGRIVLVAILRASHRCSFSRCSRNGGRRQQGRQSVASSDHDLSPSAIVVNFELTPADTRHDDAPQQVRPRRRTAVAALRRRM